MGPTTRRPDRWVAWTIAVVVLTGAYAVAVALTGGFKISLAGVRLSSHSWQRPAAVAAIGAVIVAVAARAWIAAASARLASVLEASRACTWLVTAAAIWTLSVGIGFGTFASGGADSYGYVGQARLLAHGRLTDTIPVSRDYQWPNVEYTLTPLGFTKGRSPGVIAPLYPPGLPLFLAPFSLVSESAVYVVVPIFGVLLIWTTYCFSARCGDRAAGAWAVMFLSVSPTFLNQVVQPMSDVPCAACWLAALVTSSRASVRASLGSGVLCSLAILIRPNLAPLALIVAFVCVSSSSEGLRPSDSPTRSLAGAQQPRSARVGSLARSFAGLRALSFLAGIVPGLVVLGWIQFVRYGSPFASGYGTVSDVFAFEYVVPNLNRYPRWITESHTPFVWLWLLAPVWIVRCAKNQRLAWSVFALSVAVWLAYLPYLFFQPNEWFYTRFLLPAIPIMIFFSTASVLAGIRALPAVWRVPAVAMVLLLVGTPSLRYAQQNGVFDVRKQERKYPLAGEFVRTRGPANAFVLAAQHSGSIRYYANRPTLRWDLLSPTRLDQVLAAVRAQGYEPLLVVDTGEYEDFRARFAATGQQAVQQLTPLAVLGDARVFAFK
jgi:4-amino-4-deoxy-L-arabinose transferase-like glycosyltransferase